jgi:seryl-tRNA synthetase
LIDLRAARADPEGFRAALARKGAAEAFDELLAADERWRELETRASDLRAQTKTKGKPTPEQLEQLRELKAELQRVEADHEEAAQRRQELLDRVPKPPHP